MRPSRSSASASRSRPDAPCWPISASPLLGIVGAGGIGNVLNTQLKFFNYENVSVVIIELFVFVLVIEFISIALRRRLV